MIAIIKCFKMVKKPLPSGRAVIAMSRKGYVLCPCVPPDGGVK